MNREVHPDEPESPRPDPEAPRHDDPEAPRPEEALTSAFEEGWPGGGTAKPAEPAAAPGPTQSAPRPEERPEPTQRAPRPAPGEPAQRESSDADALGRIEARATEVLDGVESTVAQLEERLTGALTDVSEVTQGMMSTAVEAFSTSLSQLSQRLETAAERTDVDALRSALAEAFEAFQGQLRAAAEVANRIPQRVEAMLASLAQSQGQLRSDVGQIGRQTLEQGQVGVTRLEELAQAFQDMAKRRGMKTLVEGEERMLEEQRGFAVRLTAVEERLGQLTEAIEHQRGLQNAVSALEGRMALFTSALEERVMKVTELEKNLSEDLQKEARAVLDEALGRFEESVPQALLGEEGVINLQELVERQGLTEKAIAVLGRETKDLLKRLEGWGKPRATPRLAQQVDDIEGRMAELEGGVSTELVDGVSARLEGLFERRFEALVRLLETRVRQLSDQRQVTEEEPTRFRGLFRRSRE